MLVQEVLRLHFTKCCRRHQAAHVAVRTHLSEPEHYHAKADEEDHRQNQSAACIRAFETRVAIREISAGTVPTPYPLVPSAASAIAKADPLPLTGDAFVVSPRFTVSVFRAREAQLCHLSVESSFLAFKTLGSAEMGRAPCRARAADLRCRCTRAPTTICFGCEPSGTAACGGAGGGSCIQFLRFAARTLMGHM